MLIIGSDFLMARPRRRNWALAGDYFSALIGSLAKARTYQNLNV